MSNAATPTAPPLVSTSSEKTTPSPASTSTAPATAPKPGERILERASDLTGDAGVAAADVAKTLHDAASDTTALPGDLDALRADVAKLKADRAEAKELLEAVRELPGQFADMRAEFRVITSKVHLRALLGGALGVLLIHIASIYFPKLAAFAPNLLNVFGAGCTPAEQQVAAKDARIVAADALTGEQYACCFANVLKPDSSVAGLCRLTDAQVVRFRDELARARLDQAVIDYADAHAPTPPPASSPPPDDGGGARDL